MLDKHWLFQSNDGTRNVAEHSVMHSKLNHQLKSSQRMGYGDSFQRPYLHENGSNYLASFPGLLTPPVFDRLQYSPGLPPPFLHTASDQKLEV